MKKTFVYCAVILSVLLSSSCAPSAPSQSSSQPSSSTDSSQSGSLSYSAENINSIEDIKNFFCITDYSASKPNTAGGVDCNITFWSFGDIIKYVTFWVEPYNAVNDVVSCEIQKTSEIKVKYTGPTEISEPTGIVLENAWYNHTIQTICINKVEIELTNGEIFETDSVESLIVEGIEQNYGMYGISKKNMQKVINNALDEKGLTKEDFISGVSENMKSTIEDVLNPSSKLSHVPVSVCVYIASTLGISTKDLIYSI